MDAPQQARSIQTNDSNKTYLKKINHSRKKKIPQIRKSQEKVKISNPLRKQKTQFAICVKKIQKKIL